MKRRLFALLAVLALCAGCSTQQSQINRHNAVVYVQGVLDETYTGAPEEGYLTLVKHTDEDAKRAFEKNLAEEFSQRLALRFQLEEKFVSRELKRDFLALLDKVYQSARCQVKSATELEGGRYCVEVTVTPVTFFAAAYQDGFKALRADFEKKHALDEDDAQLDAAQRRKATEQFEAQWAQAVYDYLYARLDAVTTGPAVNKLVLVSADEKGMYSLSQTDLQDVDDLVLQY